MELQGLVLYPISRKIIQVNGIFILDLGRNYTLFNLKERFDTMY